MNPNNKIFNVTEIYEIHESRNQKHHVNIKELCVKGKDLINYILSFKPETHYTTNDSLNVTIRNDEDVFWGITIREARERR